MFPQIVPQKSELARLVIHDAHFKTLHGGTNQTIAEVHTRFWIRACRNQVRKVILNCIICCRFNSKFEKPLKGDLPKLRKTVPFKAFQHDRLDFGGPFFAKVKVKISQKYIKFHLCALPVRQCIWRSSLISQPKHVLPFCGSLRPGWVALQRLIQKTVRTFKAPLQSS